LAGPVAFNAVAFAEPDLAATATSLAGAMQMLASGTAMALLGLFAPVDPLRLAVALCLSTSTALSCALLARRVKL
jgi:DHA1 family bicyclomycin/chloramphenicol resistance-like MFS transporter